MGAPKKIGIELLDENLINQLLKLVGTGGSVSYNDSALRSQIDTLDKTKVDYVELKSYFNKVTEKINKEMLDTTLADAIDKAAAASGIGAGAIKKENLSAELQSDIEMLQSDISTLKTYCDTISKLELDVSMLSNTAKEHTNSINEIDRKISNLKADIQSVKQGNVITGCFVNNNSELQDAINSGTANEIYDLLNNRVYRKKSAETEDIELPVSWDLSPVNKDVSRTYVVNGTLTLSSGIKNVDGVTPQIAVNVKKKSVTPTAPYIDKITSPVNDMIMVEVGTSKRFIEPSLPYYVILSVIGTDGKTTEMSASITWDMSKYNENACGRQMIPGIMSLPSTASNPFNLGFSMFVYVYNDSPSMVSRNITEYDLSKTSVEVAYGTLPSMSSLPSKCTVTVIKNALSGSGLYQTIDNEYPLTTSNSRFYNTIMLNPETGKQFFFDGTKLYVF